MTKHTFADFVFNIGGLPSELINYTPLIKGEENLLFSIYRDANVWQCLPLPWAIHLHHAYNVEFFRQRFLYVIILIEI